MSYLKSLTKVRWMLVFYDFLVYLFSVCVFFVYYRGGGILRNDEIFGECVLAFLCVFVPRFFGKIYSMIWRYGGVQSYMKLIMVDMVGSFAYILLDHFLPVVIIATSRVISVMAVNMLGCLIMRMMYRYAFKCADQETRTGKILSLMLRVFAGRSVTTQHNDQKKMQNIAIVGAGRTGVSLAEELINNEGAGARAVCFIDIKDYKIGREIRGLPVLSQDKITMGVLQKYEVDEIVFAVPGMDVDSKKSLYETFRNMGYPIRVYDRPIMETAGAKPQLRNFEVEEVLFRDPIVVTDEKTEEYYRDKVILVTGGGGSIGSELSRQVARMKPRKLILLDIYENGVYDVQQELRMKYGSALDVSVEILSITNRKALAKVFEQYRPQIVIHAAAHKHVPLMEHNCVEAVINNVFGTENVVELCEEYGAARFMALSTDKAVNPTNVMGATKRMCEFIMQAHSTEGHVRYSATRFGNVLGSAGSVIPLFKRQIAAGGPITVTDKRIIRYFMTIPEASQLVLQSGAMAKNGELFVLDMGQPVKILDLAKNMIHLSGLVPDRDIKIVETGLRPGEKLYEELLVKTEELDKTANNMIFVERDHPISMKELNHKLEVLKAACETEDNDTVREALRSVVPTFYRPEEINRQVG